jgi:hypothetical protein
VPAFLAGIGTAAAGQGGHAALKRGRCIRSSCCIRVLQIVAPDVAPLQNLLSEIEVLPFTYNRDVFVTTGMVAVLTCLGNRARDFIRVDAPVRQGLDEIARLAIGPGSMGAAFLALGQALVDAVAVRLVGDDEDAAVGRCN